MNPCEEMLALLSVRGRCSSVTARRYSQELALRRCPDVLPEKAFHRLISPLNRLGHVECDEKGSLYVTPPTVVRVQECEGIVYGIRLPWMKEALNQIEGIFLEVGDSQKGPGTWRLRWRERACLDQALAALKAELVEERGQDLLSTLPTLSQVVVGLGEVPFQEARLEKLTFARRNLKAQWLAGEGSEEGLYRAQANPHGGWFVHHQGKWRRARTREFRLLCFWHEVRRLGRLRAAYRPSTGTLAVPAAYPLPLMMERALVAPAGDLPRWWDGRLYYESVDPPRACAVARIFEVELEEIP